MLDALKEWLPIVGGGLNLIALLLWWSARQYFIPRKDFAAHMEAEHKWQSQQEAAVLKLDGRINLTELRIASLPRVEDITSIRADLAAVKGKGEAAAQSLHTLTVSVQRIEDHLMRSDKA